MTDELLGQFLAEGQELLQQAAEDLLALERNPADTARIDSVFRAFHTLKGGVGLFELAPMAQAVHAAEDLLDALRGARIPVARPAIDALLACVGVAERWMAVIARTGTLPHDAAAAAAQLAARLRAPLGQAAPGGAAPAPLAADTGWFAALRAAHPDVAAASGLRYTPRRDCFFAGDDPLAIVRALPDLAALAIARTDEADPAKLDPFACDLVIAALSTAPAAALRAACRLVSDQVEFAEATAPDDAEPVLPEAGQRRITLDATRLDTIGDLTGALMVAGNRLGQIAAELAATTPGRRLADAQGEIDQLLGRLHRAVTAARLVPMSQTTRRLLRLLREAAAGIGKEVRLDIAGAAVTADKTVVDAVFEPLLHALRNAVDHGIEPAPVRRAAGKPPQGQIALRIAGSGEQIELCVTDDGAGIDLAALRRAVAAKGLVTAAAAAALDEAGLLDLLFAPGFSTAAAVTELSGRGVGLDAVRTAIRALGGSVVLTTVPGRGSTLRMTIPQSVALATLLTVRVGRQWFGVPIAAVVETLRVPRDQVRRLRDGHALVVRGRTLSLLCLATLLRLPADADPPPRARLLVVRAGTDDVALEVDEFGRRLELMLRPLDGLLAGLPGFLGTALPGDGGVLLVLDLPALLA